MEPLVAPLLSMLLMTTSPSTLGSPEQLTVPAIDQDTDVRSDTPDLCPGECSTDTDMDGVPDWLDRCGGTDPDAPGVNQNGCSVRDLKKERPYRFPVWLT